MFVILEHAAVIPFIVTKAVRSAFLNFSFENYHDIPDVLCEKSFTEYLTPSVRLNLRIYTSYD